MAVLNALGGGAAGGGRLKIKQFLTPGSATFTVPAGVSRVEVVVIGGGKDGGNGISTSSFINPGIGGRSGAACYACVNVTPGQAIPITVAASQGTSSFGTYLSCSTAVSTSGIADEDIIWSANGVEGKSVEEYTGGTGGCIVQHGAAINMFGAMVPIVPGSTGSADTMVVSTGKYNMGGRGGDGGFGGGGGGGGTVRANEWPDQSRGGHGGDGGVGGGGGGGGRGVSSSVDGGSGGKGGPGAVFVAWEA